MAKTYKSTQEMIDDVAGEAFGRYFRGYEAGRDVLDEAAHLIRIIIRQSPDISVQMAAKILDVLNEYSPKTMPVLSGKSVYELEKFTSNEGEDAGD